MALVGQNFANGGTVGSALLMDAGKPSTNGTNGISKLSQMQARFQQRQLQEKEQKLLRLYESQQQRAFQRVNRGSAGSSSVSSTTSSTTSSSSLGNGKVRQLFDERRTQTKTNSKTSGWDRSYPLEPLENTRVRQNRTTGLTRGASLERINNQPIKKVVSRSRSQVRPGNLINAGYGDRSRQPQEYRSTYADEEYNYLQDELDTPYYNRDKNSNRYYNQDRELEQFFSNSRPNLYDNEEPLRDGETFDETQLFKKLTNVGGILLMKERTMNDDKYKTYNANSRRAPAAVKSTPREEPSQRTSTQPLRRRDNDAEPTSPPSRTATKAAVKRFEPTSSPPPTNGQVPRKGVPPRTVNAANTPLRTTSNIIRQAGPVTSSPRAGSSKPAAPKTAPSPRPSPRQAAPPQDNLSECIHCGRRFANDRVQMHQEICAKTTQKKRKVFDPVKQRVKGTEAEAYVKIASKQQKQAKEPAPKKSDWRRKHEEFINAIRAAKEVKAHLAAGGKLSDLPPPPPSENLDYVQCPHCSRRFNEAAAERHIPRCADMQHNKPKPKAQAAKVGGPFGKKR